MFIDIATPELDTYLEIAKFARGVYLEKFEAKISPSPDVFAYASFQERIVGCLGLYRALETKLVLVERYVPDAFARISGEEHVDRSLCAEIGTRAVVQVAGFHSGDVSVALAASLIAHAKSLGVRYFGLTSNRTVSLVVRALGIDLIKLGEPNLANLDQEFRENWRIYFEVKQFCFGMQVESTDGCFVALSDLKGRGIESKILRA